MVHVIMMCGLCGSGKTTYALEKEKEGYIRLSIDEEMWKVYGKRGVDYPADKYDELSKQIELQLQEELVCLIKSGQNVILDFSFWNKENRNKYKKLIEELEGTVDLVYLKADIEVLRKRLQIRNQSIHVNSPYEITDDILERYYNGFQEPLGEGEIIIIQK
ncbi:AAA family ATPase [Anaeropeptidivorans aminofermentans]|uniref:AAA family ATPase n=1 Tax=Anaeropeptidivorans aminofermentans TaxID=2934315 RepID=UPI0020256D11|nr:ATP-binding protein [Anaeropeptidivorans aminofermentans]MBE6011839.1 ATP-binding protein [Lachnospiraceae bacterium]